MQGSAQTLSDLSSLKADHKTIHFPQIAHSFLALSHMNSHFSRAGFGSEMPSLFLLKSSFTTENGFLMSSVPEFTCYKGKIFQALLQLTLKTILRIPHHGFHSGWPARNSSTCLQKHQCLTKIKTFFPPALIRHAYCFCQQAAFFFLLNFHSIQKNIF